MMNKTFVLFIMLISSIIFSGCSKEGSEGRESSNEIVIGIAQDLDDSLDPHLSVSAGTKEIMYNVFEGLVKPDESGNMVPALADKVEISDGGKTYIFTLRDGVRFHNGQLVKMEDVIYSLEKNADTSKGEALIPALSLIADKKYDEHTLKIILKEPVSEFLSYFKFAIIPKGYRQQDVLPIGTGPFKFISRTAQDNIVLERFDDYWGTLSKIKRVTYKVIENAEGLLLGLHSGALDLVVHLTSSQVEQLSESDFDIEIGSMNLVQALYLNNDCKPFNDIRVRQALCYGIDKKEIIDLAFNGYGKLIGSAMYPAFEKYFDDSLTNYYNYNVEKAKKLLSEAGYSDGFGMTIVVPSNYRPHVDTAQVIAEQLKKIGVNVDIKLVEWSFWLNEVYKNRNFQSTIIGLPASDMTAGSMLERYNSSASNNFINYKDKAYDSLFNESLVANDFDYTEICKLMEKNLTENAASVYIQDIADLVAVRKNLKGFTFYPFYILDVSKLYWSR